MKSAFIFPGQGSQTQGMLSGFAAAYPDVLKTFEEASEVLEYDLWKLIQDDAEKLNQTEFTQPALLTASVALWRLWQSQDGALPDVMAGHSLGEYSALVCAGAITFVDGVKLVAKRGEYMQLATKPGEGAMAAVIKLDDDKIIALCDELKGDDVLSAANFNAIGQVVVAGHADAIARFAEAAKAAGAKMVKILPVSVPSHCELMQPAVMRLHEYIAGIDIISPSIPVIHNVDVAAHVEPEEIRVALLKQLTSPVRWVETIQSLVEKEISLMVECGPGAVLAGLNKRIDKQIQTNQTASPEQFGLALGKE